jgi:predicted transcriptional regulator of viral defense system
MDRMGPLRAVRELAARQQGVVTLAQMRGLGVSWRQVRRATERAELIRIHHGVYRVGPVVPPYCLEMAASLAVGSVSAVSHRSAPYLYGMLPRLAGPVHVTVCGRHVRGDQGIVIHETSSLQPHEIRERHGIPVTAPVRTLVDLAADCSDRDLHQAVAEAFVVGLTTLPALRRAAAAYRGRRGVGRLQDLLESGARRTRSRGERNLLAAVRHDPEIPEPETNVNIGRWEVDFLWRDAGVAVEVDDYSTHSSPQSFERDRRKDAELGALGLTVQRFTSSLVDEDLGFILAWLRQST